jgi:hypothetical protein
MENTEIRSPRGTTLNLHQIETFVFFAAMLLAITLEGACVYWLWLPGTMPARPETQVSLVGQWTAATLPQCWLLGAVAVLVYHTAMMFVPRRTLQLDDLLRNRQTFVRLWRWVMAIAAVQMCGLYLDRMASRVP